MAVAREYPLVLEKVSGTFVLPRPDGDGGGSAGVAVFEWHDTRYK